MLGIRIIKFTNKFCCPFPSSLYSSFPLNLPHSLSTFLIPSQPSSFPLNLPLSTFLFLTQSSLFPPNLPCPYFSSFLSISFPTYILPYLSTSLPSTSLPSYLSPLPTLPFFPLLSQETSAWSLRNKQDSKKQVNSWHYSRIMYARDGEF